MSEFPPKIDIALKPDKKPDTGWKSGMLRGTRQKVLDDVNASALTAAQKSVLVEEIGLIEAKHELIQVYFHRHKHQSGGNGTYTVTEL